MAKWYGLFGLGSPYQDTYVVIEAPDYTEAHMIMREKFGNNWTQLLDEAAWTRTDYRGWTKAQKFNLTEIPLP